MKANQYLSRQDLMTCGWHLVSSNDEGTEIWEQAKEELFYDYYSGRIIGVFNKNFLNKIREKNKKT